MIDQNQFRRFSNLLRVTNVLLLLLLLAAALTVDGNGRIFGMDYGLSVLASATLFLIATASAIGLVVCDSSWRLFAITLLVIYAALLLPLLFV
mgnify:CR=1 FL=1